MPQEITIEQLFSGQTTYIWKLGDYNGDDDLIAQGIVGYLTPHYIGTNDKVDKQATAVKITGRVFKITPSWAEINIGQSEKQLALEVIVLGERYLLFEPEWKRQYFNKLPKRCIFENHED
ncbi:hypothetical protein JCM19231_2045 [Vibrio ishigakensis]|uniref:Uncharacterized protein n=1 Tax=Vibrio ishigakensis TaxID=1481914 RepID=A0A0B8NXB2_9VIBR|nr:hypothetical protein JCM19231_2045 [Vibrio ishigakensis]